LFHQVLTLLAMVDARFPDSATDRREGRDQILSFLDLLGDAAGSAKLNELAASGNIDESLAAKGAQGLANWMRDSKDAAAQKIVLDQMEALAKANPNNDSLAKTLMVMSNLGPASAENSKRATNIVSTVLTGQAAKDYQAYMAQRNEADAAAGDLKALENKPLVIKGTTVDGKAFTTADWKGKVILVDFWATWCGPCRGELPNVKKLYSAYHDKGFEIVGVSCDNAADDLTNFLKDDGGMPWPQIFDAAHPGWSPIATGFGINGIPTMFLIDKAGVLRTVEARAKAKDLVPKLLEETPATEPAVAK
jgi:thiol-disulfide isomerase/thioredoxin